MRPGNISSASSGPRSIARPTAWIPAGAASWPIPSMRSCSGWAGGRKPDGSMFPVLPRSEYPGDLAARGAGAAARGPAAAERRFEPLPDDDSPRSPVSMPGVTTFDRPRCLALLETALEAALAALEPRERLRIACYYAQGLKLAEIGRLLGEHEATASRQLARTRRTLREAIEQQLKDRGVRAEEMAECFESVTADAGPLDLDRLLAAASRKESAPDRSDE